MHEDSFVESETASYFRFWQNRFNDWERNGLSFLGLDAFYLQPAGSILESAVGLNDGVVSALYQGDAVELATPQFRILFTNAFGAPENDCLPHFSAGL